MAFIDLYTLLEANAKLAREKKELVRLVRILSQAVREMGTAADLYGEGMAIEAYNYRSIPKGFILAMMKNREMVSKMTEQARQSAENVDVTMHEFVGDDETMGNAYYNSLVDELTRLSNRNAKTMKQDIDMWMLGTMGSDGKINFKGSPKMDPKSEELYKKHKKEIDKFINDHINKLFKTDPKNFGGDLEGEWQDGIDPQGTD